MSNLWSDGIKNAVIGAASINDAQRGLLTVDLTLEYGDGSFQGFGGYTLYLPPNYTHHSLASPNYAGLFIWRCMEVAGCDDWAKMKGRPVRVRVEKEKVVAVGHFVKDVWFCPDQEFSQMREVVEAAGCNA